MTNRRLFLNTPVGLAPDSLRHYGSIREMQEAEGMIEKGAPLWEYGVSGESGVMKPFDNLQESGIMPGWQPVYNEHCVQINKKDSGFSDNLDTYPLATIERFDNEMAPDGNSGRKMNDQSYENLRRINMGLSPMPTKPADYDKVPVLLEPGTTCYPRNYIKVIRREIRRGELKLETDKDCDFVGRAADL